MSVKSLKMSLLLANFPGATAGFISDLVKNAQAEARTHGDELHVVDDTVPGYAEQETPVVVAALRPLGG